MLPNYFSLYSQIQDTQIDRARDLIFAAAAAGDLTLLRCMSYVLGPPHDHKFDYERALVSACDAGQANVVRALLSMGVTPQDSHALECARTWAGQCGQPHALPGPDAAA